MIKNVLSNIGGISAYGVISICLFFAVFIGMCIWAMQLEKTFSKDMSALPLNDGERRKGNSHD